MTSFRVAFVRLQWGRGFKTAERPTLASPSKQGSCEVACEREQKFEVRSRIGDAFHTAFLSILLGDSWLSSVHRTPLHHHHARRFGCQRAQSLSDFRQVP